MSFITGLIIGLFIGAWIGLLAMCLCRISARQEPAPHRPRIYKIQTQKQKQKQTLP
ncbi:TPA: DUF3789 domain-containing protein [Klebsiella aerogenes]|uniref:DUF3789 domain-containing protein n=1 Tax=Klebsiella aerogenes TaxID=548 RepID=UPI00278B5FB6|nr:DUF3789 domain-containing protein [Klebsiella aerogenes]MEB5738569.1 DUF3789 domain-containing protein [Klebsiella aerogenes]HDT0776041.1 DUF3789 domain-containing protein [Klebsiella aerogenes]HDU6292169.1 DUF3789 domain-containing protein [Klebsiella aerogenes]